MQIENVAARSGLPVVPASARRAALGPAAPAGEARGAAGPDWHESVQSATGMLDDVMSTLGGLRAFAS